MNSYKWILFAVLAFLLSFGLTISACDGGGDDDDDDDDDNDDDNDDNDDNPLDDDDDDNDDNDDNENEFRNGMCSTIAWQAYICDQSLDADGFYELCVDDSLFDCLLECYYKWYWDTVQCHALTNCLEDCIY